MSKHSRILNSSIKTEIDKLLLEGKSFKEVEEYCKNNDLKLSYISIKKYAEDILLINNVPNLGKVTSIDPKELHQEIKSLLPEKSDFLNKRKLKNLFLNNLVCTCEKTLNIIKDKTELYEKGEGAIPKDDLLTLKNLMFIAALVTKPNSSSLSIFDLDIALGFGVKDYVAEVLQQINEEYNF